MTTEEKLKHFLDITVRDVSSIGDSMVSDYQKSLDDLFNEHKEAALRQSEHQIQVEREHLRKEANTELTRQQLHIKRKISRKYAALKEQLFEEVKTQIDAFMKTEEYASLLIKQILQSKELAGNQYIIIYIDPKDADKLELLQKRTGMQLKVSEYSFIGGIRTVIPYKNILIDDSFEKKLEAAKEKFVFGGISNE